MKNRLQVGTLDSLVGGITDPNRMALFIHSRGDCHVLRTNALLAYDQWKDLDTAILETVKETLTAVEDLRSRGLTHNVGGLGATMSQWQTLGDMTAADVDMAGVTAGEEDRLEFGTQGVPIPIIHKNYRINFREQLAGGRMGVNIDPLTAVAAARVVAEKAEDILFNGVSIKSGGYTVYGYTNFPSTNDVDIAGSWNTTPANIVPDVELMLAAADALHMTGPFLFYMPITWWGKLRSDISATYRTGTYRERLAQYTEVAAWQKTSRLTSTVVMVQARREVVDLAIGSDVQNIEWSTMGPLVQHNKVLMAMAPRLKVDANSVCGIFHGQVLS